MTVAKKPRFEISHDYQQDCNIMSNGREKERKNKKTFLSRYIEYYKVAHYMYSIFLNQNKTCLLEGWDRKIENSKYVQTKTFHSLNGLAYFWSTIHKQ